MVGGVGKARGAEEKSWKRVHTEFEEETHRAQIGKTFFDKLVMPELKLHSRNCGVARWTGRGGDIRLVYSVGRPGAAGHRQFRPNEEKWQAEAQSPARMPSTGA